MRKSVLLSVILSKKSNRPKRKILLIFIHLVHTLLTVTF